MVSHIMAPERGFRPRPSIDTLRGDLDCDGVEDLPVGARRDDGILNYSFAEVVYHILTT